ncbi:MAG: long-chain fatty acid--CoA ligase [Deltaproteobacteria bacterium]|nr:MAG: long-chain fatty acid--CoA ligase [Deltaproteobacteria bacterium]
MAYATSHVEQILQLAQERAETTVGYDDSSGWLGAQWLQRIHQWTGCLAQRGVQPGTRVAVALSPSWDSLAALVALWRLGGSGLVLPPSTNHELASWLNAAGVAGALVEQTHTSWLGASDGLEWGLARHSTDESLFQSLASALESAPSVEEKDLPALEPEREALHSLSAGTWHPPLGVTLNHKQLWAAVDSLQKAWTAKVERGTLGHLCLPASITQVTTALGIFFAGDAVMLPSTRELESLTKSLSLQETVVPLATAQCVRLWMGEANHEALQPDRIPWIWALGGFVSEVYPSTWNVPVFPAYKMEACGGIVAWANQTNAGVGSLFSDLKPHIERKEHRHLKPGDTREGLLYVQGERVSFQRFRPETPSFDIETSLVNWLPTGDWCSLDARQQLHVVGHSEDMIVYRDRRFSIRPIEGKLREHPQIRSAVLCSVEEKGLLKAFVEVDPSAPGRTMTSRHVLAYIQEHFPHYMLPKYVEFRETLPRNHFGEIARWALR